MRRNMLNLVALSLIFCWLTPAECKKIRVVFPEKTEAPFSPNRLSMMEDAVDDMYFGCNRMTTEKINDTFGREIRENKLFSEVWKRADQCANTNLENREKGDEGLTKNHMQAICVYTSNFKKFYQTFNDAVQKKSKCFPYRSLHFWLTSAIQMLSDDTKCKTTYRRTNLKLKGKVNKIIRFGFFASSSYRKDLYQFGNKTCFKIQTCSGASLKNYSLIEGEEEVLIPPYEKFKITKETKGTKVGLEHCKVVYFLESAGVQSNLNCNVPQAGKEKGFPRLWEYSENL